MNHTGTQTIETKRLILRRFTMNDVLPMYTNWASDPAVTKYLTWPTHTGPDVTEMVLKSWVTDYEKPAYYQWAIAFKETPDDPIGGISVVSHDDRVKKCEIGYCLGRTWWHKGVMSEALAAVIDYMFDNVGMNRVEARHDTNNPNSGAVMKKCGMKYEGTLRQAGMNNQGVRDEARYAILKSDRQN